MNKMDLINIRTKSKRIRKKVESIKKESDTQNHKEDKVYKYKE